jgi:hypothetical protein
MGMQTYYDIKKMLCKELDEARDKGRIADISDLKTIDLLTHSLKSISTIIAMEESGYEGKSGHYPIPPFMYGNRSFDDQSYDDRSMAQRRNAMGQFSRDDYNSYSMRRSRDNGMAEELRELMSRAKDEETRMKFKRFIMDLEEGR